MPLQGAYTLNTPIASTDTSLPIAVRDALLDGSNDGVRFLFDTAFGFSYPGGPLAGRAAAGAPANGAVIGDISEHANGSFINEASQVIGYAGAGFDFSTMTSTVAQSHNQVRGPAAVWGADQRFCVFSYMRLPTLADWNVSTSIFPVFIGSDLGYQTAPDPVTIAFANGGLINARRQTALNAADQTSVLGTSHYGLMAQVAAWRTTNNNFVLRVKSAAGSVSSFIASATANALDCSAVTPRFGVGKGFTDYGINTSQRTARNFRLYRGGIENLALSGRDPVAVLDADWTRVQARIAASAAANGGTSLIFV